MFLIQEKWELPEKLKDEFNSNQETKEEILLYVRELIERLQENGEGFIIEIISENGVNANVTIGRENQKIGNMP